LRREDLYIMVQWNNLREGANGIPRRRWEDNIEMDVGEVGWGA
jgi:hypothetical protein